MGAGGECATGDGCREVGCRTHVTDGAGGEDGAGRYTDEGGQAIPAGIYPGDLVCKKFHAVHQARSEHHHRVGQDLQVRGEIDMAGAAHVSQHEDGGIQIDAAGPGNAHGQCNCLGDVHAAATPEKCACSVMAAPGLQNSAFRHCSVVSRWRHVTITDCKEKRKQGRKNIKKRL